MVLQYEKGVTVQLSVAFLTGNIVLRRNTADSKEDFIIFVLSVKLWIIASL